MKVDQNKIVNYLSDYLTFGFKEEEYKIVDIDISDNIITSKIELTNCFIPKFHFTVPLAFRVIAQLAIIFTCIRQNYDRKPGEVLLRDINLKCRKEILKTKNVNICLEITKFKDMGEYIYFIGDINIEDGAILGTGSLILPKLNN